jgi:hypothetical protein
MAMPRSANEMKLSPIDMTLSAIEMTLSAIERTPSAIEMTPSTIEMELECPWNDSRAQDIDVDRQGNDSEHRRFDPFLLSFGCE